MNEAKIIADSKHWQTETRLTTFEVSFPRWVLAEFNTHRQLSRNSASSRAIPIKSNIENILNDTAIPVHWGLNQAGMVADNAADESTAAKAKEIWLNARDSAIEYANQLSELGIHKQIANRLIENFTYQKVIVTATEWSNFFWLRNHKDAQPEIKALAEKMWEAYTNSTPTVIEAGEWHVPYFENGIWTPDSTTSLEDALKISASCCAQVSYRKQDDSLEKAIRVFEMLNLDSEDDDVRMHSSPIEHQGTPIDVTNASAVSAYISHVDSRLNFCSGNFKDFIQYRKMFKNECHSE